MSKLEPLHTITTGFMSAAKLASNFSRITAAFENTLSRDGSSPNSMEAVLDMNSHRVINTGAPIDPNDVATKDYVDQIVMGGPVTVQVHWNDILDKPLTFVPSPHTHVPGNIVGLNKHIQDVVGVQIVAGPNMTVTYDPNIGTTTLSASVASTVPWDNVSEIPDPISAIAGVTPATDRYVYFTSDSAATTGTITSFGRSFLNDADAAAGRSTLGLGTAATSASTDFAAASHNHTSANITDFTEAVQDVVGDQLVAGSNMTVTYNDTTGKITLASTGGGGGGSSDWGDLTSVPDVITAIAAVGPDEDEFIYFSDTTTAEVATVTPFARSLLDDADASTARATLGISGLTTPDEFERIMLRMMMSLSELRGNQFGTPNSIADDFSDEDGVDASGSTGETYDGAADLYKATLTAGSPPNLTGNSAPSGYSARASAEFSSSYQAWRARDGIKTGDANTRWACPGSSGWVEFGFPNEVLWTSYTITGLDLPLDPGSSVAQNPRNWTIYGSNSPMGGTGGTLLDTRSSITFSVGEEKVFTISNPRSFKYYEIRISSNNGDAVATSIAEMTFTGYTASSAIDLRSIAYPAISNPTRASIMVVAKSPSTITLNTDLIGYVSRDNGTTWTAVTLIARESLGAFTAYEALGADISGQPSGSQVKWRIAGGANQFWEFTSVVVMWN